jgi:hypothetical protein
MQIDFRDGTLFGNDAGEDERPEILNSYFVDQPSFRSFFERGSNFRVARSRKGMGKSALLSKLAYDLRNDPSNPIVINATGASLIGLLAKPKDMSYLSLQSYWYSVLLTRINQEIGN